MNTLVDTHTADKGGNETARAVAIFEAAARAGTIDAWVVGQVREAIARHEYGSLHAVLEVHQRQAEAHDRYVRELASLSESGLRFPATREIRRLPVSSLRPSPENDSLYKPVDPTAPDIIELAERIKVDGVLEPLVVSVDNFIISGHRRYAAAKLAGEKTVPCRVEAVYHAQPDFVKLLREYNRQREKTHDEKLREAIIDADPEEEHRALVQHRAEKAKVAAVPIVITGTKRRAAISKAKLPMMLAIDRVLAERREFWPLSDRQIHYGLLNFPPLVHASKPGSTYQNNLKSYKKLTELLTRARLVGRIPMEAIVDETRPQLIASAHKTIKGFIDQELDGFLHNYWRDLMQSQANHVEVVGEKNTLLGTLRPVTDQYCIPLTIGRGYSSLPPRNDMVTRFRKSGKQKLVIILLSDFDPDGDEISHSFARSIRDDFGVKDVHAVRAALTSDQVQRFQLPPRMTAKKTSVHYDKFTAKNGDNVFELEALHPAQLQDVLRETINSVIDVEAFNREVEAEKADAQFLAGVRKRAKDVLGKVA